ncbi:MAG: hypothetical protein AAF890_09500, partial [Pseudomonadota bacterium]
PVIVKSPTLDDIGNYSSQFEKYNGVRISTGADYALAGFSFVDHHCENYFVALELRRRRVNLRRNVATSVFAQSVSLLNRLGQNMAVAYVNAAGIVTNSFFDSFDKNYSYSQHSVELRRLTLQALATKKSNFFKELKNSDNLYSQPINSAASVLIAHNTVQSYARQCTPAQFELFINSALSASTAKPSGAGASGNPPAAPPTESATSGQSNGATTVTPQQGSTASSQPFVSVPSNGS